MSAIKGTGNAAESSISPVGRSVRRGTVVCYAYSMIFHITIHADWEVAASAAEYPAASLETEGFVHCSTGAQVLATTERWFPPDADLVLLELDEARTASPFDWPEVYPGQRFPHLLGPLTADAVVARLLWGPADRIHWPQP